MKQERIKIGQQELSIGDKFSFELNSIPAPIEPVSIEQEVEDIRGGGFYGKSILLKDFVIKTAEPDPWHLLWRKLNWVGYPFPPQSIEYAAQLDHLSSRVIHLVIPQVTDGAVISPDSYGYANMGSIGFAQVLERMQGRGARFDTQISENEQVKKVRKNLWDIGVALGLEQVAQVHPENPFGKQNIWLTEDGQFIWLDTLPALAHTGAVLPGFRFPFHYDIRENIGDGKITFNRLHTDKIRAFLADHPESIADADRHELEYYLAEYDAIWPAYAEEMNREQKDLVIEDASLRGLITKEQAIKFRDSNIAYLKFLGKTVVEPAIEAFSEFAEDRFVYKAFFDKQFQKDIKRFLRDPDFRRQRIIENRMLKGMGEAYLLGLVSEDEWNNAWAAAESPPIPKEEAVKLVPTYVFLQSYYAVTSSILNAIELSTYASAPFAENPGARVAFGAFMGWVVPPVVRAASTAAIARATKQDLTYATRFSAIPKAGGWIAVSADLGHRFGNRSEAIWHYTKRGLIASLSKVLRPWGGWNSDLEEKLWNSLRVEKW